MLTAADRWARWRRHGVLFAALTVGWLGLSVALSTSLTVQLPARVTSVFALFTVLAAVGWLAPEAAGLRAHGGLRPGVADGLHLSRCLVVLYDGLAVPAIVAAFAIAADAPHWVAALVSVVVGLAVIVAALPRLVQWVLRDDVPVTGRHR